MGFLIFWVMSHFPLPWVKYEWGKRDQQSEKARQRYTERGDEGRGQDLLEATGRCCHGNHREEEEEGLVNVS